MDKVKKIETPCESIHSESSYKLNFAYVPSIIKFCLLTCH